MGWIHPSVCTVDEIETEKPWLSEQHIVKNTCHGTMDGEDRCAAWEEWIDGELANVECANIHSNFGLPSWMRSCYNGQLGEALCMQGKGMDIVRCIQVDWLNKQTYSWKAAGNRSNSQGWLFSTVCG